MEKALYTQWKSKCIQQPKYCISINNSFFNNGKIPNHHAQSANMNNQHSDFFVLCTPTVTKTSHTHMTDTNNKYQKQLN